MAIASELKDSIDLLLNYRRVDPTVQDNYGNNPLDLAKHIGNQYITSILELRINHALPFNL